MILINLVLKHMLLVRSCDCIQDDASSWDAWSLFFFSARRGTPSVFLPLWHWVNYSSPITTHQTSFWFPSNRRSISAGHFQSFGRVMLRLDFPLLPNSTLSYSRNLPVMCSLFYLSRVFTRQLQVWDLISLSISIYSAQLHTRAIPFVERSVSELPSAA